MASTASEKSFASVPVVWMVSASTPASGPSPTAATKINANTSSLIARKASISRRTGKTIQAGARLVDDSKTEGDREDDRKERSPNGHLHRFEHQFEIASPVAEIRLKKILQEQRHVIAAEQNLAHPMHVRRNETPDQEHEEHAPQSRTSNICSLARLAGHLDLIERFCC